MADRTSGLTSAQTGSPLGHKLNRLRNLALQGAGELKVQPASGRAHSPYYVELAGGPPTLRRFGESGQIEVTPDALNQLVEKNGNAAVDLVFVDNSCIDLRFKLPDGLLPELRQIIDNEIQFRSPFSEGASLWFWTAEELPDHKWQARAAVTLKKPIEALLDQLSDAGLTVGVVRRDAKDTHFAALPQWAGLQAQTSTRAGMWTNLPGLVKLPVLGAGIFCASAIALTIQNTAAHSQLSTQAAEARATISAQAQASAGLGRLSMAVGKSTQKLALTGVLSALLPDGVWLDQLVIEDDTVTMIGFAPSAADVTRLLATLPQLSDIKFASPVTRDNTQSLERFRIAATLDGPNR